MQSFYSLKELAQKHQSVSNHLWGANVNDWISGKNHSKLNIPGEEIDSSDELLE